VLLVHGGGWTGGDRSEMASAARELAKSGYVAVSVSYRLLSPVLKLNYWPAQLDDLQRAVRWVRTHAAELGVDPERVGAYGYSAGAHLAAMLGVRETRDNADPEPAAVSSRVSCVVSLGGDMDLTRPYEDDFINQMLRQFVGGETEAEVMAGLADASPLTWVDAETAPVLIAHGGRDDAILADQSRRMVAALYDAGVESVYVTIPSISHGGIGTWSQTAPLVLVFLGMHLHPLR
jgi:acetyl esterase/lipase